MCRESDNFQISQPRGSRVVWARRDRPAIDVEILRMPGIVVDRLPDGWALVAWPDREGWVIPDDAYELSSFREVTTEEFDRVVRELRRSDWPGLPPELYF
jgi:hypothetical protein